MVRVAKGALTALLVVLVAAACGGGLSDAERLWCVDHNREVLDTMDILYPFHWEGNEEAKAEALSIQRQLEDGELDQQEGNLLLAEIFHRYWPSEYERGCKAAYTAR